MRVFAAFNIKGGVGKTATAVNLAWVSARSGRRTLLWDLDPQGAASYYFRIRPRIAGGSARLVARGSDLRDFVRGSDFDDLDVLPADFSHRGMDLELERAKRPDRRLAQLLEPLAEAGPGLRAGHPGLAEQIAQIGQQTDQLRMDAQNRRSG